MKPNNPLVSIIIPTYNRAHLISETLDSVLAQTYPHWECIVVDDGSTDHTEEVVQFYVKKDSRFRFYHRPPEHKPGGSGARNYGFKMCNGDYVNWFDDDDIMLSNFLGDKIDFVNDGYDLIILNGSYVDENLIFTKEMPLIFRGNIFKEYLLWEDLNIITNSILFKKLFIEKYELFNVNIFRGQETEFFSRIFFEINNKQFKIENKITFLYRQHKTTKTSKNINFINKFKESQAFIYYNNLLRSFKIKDKELINHHLLSLNKILIQSIHNENYIIAKKVNTYLCKVFLKNFDMKNLFSQFILSFPLIYLKIRSYRIEKKLKQLKF
ncbi:MAG: glycosyltransferase family 2 protein [Flavobacterium sp.]